MLEINKKKKPWQMIAIVVTGKKSELPLMMIDSF